MRRELPFVGLVAVALFVAGCVSVAQISNLADQRCADTFTDQLASVLAEEGEQAEVSDRLAHRTSSALASGSFGPRPFLLAAPSGTDYSFFVQRKSSGCLLRLYGRRHGFFSYTNNLTYIATRPLPRCDCVE